MLAGSEQILIDSMLQLLRHALAFAQAHCLALVKDTQE
jgi:hypothetical protein